MNDNDRYFPCIPTPVGMVPFIGFTMSVEREKELFGKKEEESKNWLDSAKPRRSAPAGLSAMLSIL